MIASLFFSVANGFFYKQKTHIGVLAKVHFWLYSIWLQITLFIVFQTFYGIHIWRIPWSFQNGCSFTFNECSRTFRVMAWRENMHTDISLLLEHNAFTCYFNIMDNITLVFCTIHVTLHFSPFVLRLYILEVVKVWQEFEHGLLRLS